ncbi:MAG: hypothetical protein ACM3L6_00830 [Deltaproteobacteria bacterium]
MRRGIILGALWVFGCLLVLRSGYAADTDKDFDALKMDVQAKGVSSADMNEIKAPVKEMLQRGASKEELGDAIAELAAGGVKGKDLKKTLESMNEMEKGGMSPGETGNLVSEVAHQARMEGVKGTGLADRVHQAIQERREQRKASESDMMEQKKSAQAAEMPESMGEEKSGMGSSMMEEHGSSMSGGADRGHAGGPGK